ncbi:VWA domain-containing protein [Streptomyces sp. NPDC059788]|uniref:VWA domain-containing protein n=1 Tax=Streptomyces sp. NPDC059788 TaxID=3346948 RepID=UPI00365304CB
MFNKLFGRSGASAPAAQPATRTSVPDLSKRAAVSLTKHGLSGRKAAVYLVLDRSGSMRRFYRDGTMQYLGERALGLSQALDDDGTVPVVFFSSTVDGTTELDLGNYAGRIDDTHAQLGHMGTTNYEAAIRAVIEHYQGSDTTEPGFVLFQTDGGPDDRRAAVQALIDAKKLPLFWSFVGFGNQVDFLRAIDDLPGGIDNTGFFHAPDPHGLTDDALYDGITAQFGPYLAAAEAQGILR